MKRILITGSNGFVGKYLINHLKDNGYTVIATDISKFNSQDGNVIYDYMDITNQNCVDQIIKKYRPEFLINLAAISSVRQSWNMISKVMEINVIGTLHILESLMKYSSNCRILLVGSSEEYASKDRALNEFDILDASNPYGCSKIAQENLARLYHEKYGLNIICTRSFNHTGPGQNDGFVLPSFCKQIAEIDKGLHEPIVKVGNLNIIRDFSDVRDIIYSYRYILENYTGFNVINIGSGIGYKLNDLLNMIISFSDKEICIESDDSRKRKNDVYMIVADTRKLTSILNSGFHYNIENTLKEMYQYYKGN